MPLSYTGIVAASAMGSAQLKQVLDLLTGVMTDQAVTLKNQLSLAPGVAAGTPLGSWGSVPVLIARATPNGTLPTLSSIPGTFKDLKLIIRGRSNSVVGNDSLYIRFNGDTRTVYYFGWHYHRSNVVTAVDQVAVNAVQIGQIPGGGSALANAWMDAEVLIADYAGSGNKSVRSIYGCPLNSTTPSVEQGQTAGFWFSTSSPLSTGAITTIDFFIGGGNSFVNGTTISLWGLP